MNNTAPIPLLNFAHYTKGTPEEKVKFCKDLETAFRRWGFVKLENYGIPASDVDELFTRSRQFFALTHEQKMSAPHPPVPNPHRGYSYVGQEFTSGLSRQREQEARRARRILDVKETFDWGATIDRTYPNVWPPEEMLPGFRNFMERYFAQAHALHLAVMGALAESLGLTQRFFPDAHLKNESEARLAHYPSVAASALGENQGTSRICEHTDSGSATLLWQDSVGGLEIEDPATGGFLPVVSPLPTVLVNLGDAMERWSNGVLPAAYHRVTQPASQDQSGLVPERFSIVYFGKPDRSFSLAPLDRFITADRPVKFPPITGDELNQKTLLQTYEPRQEAARG